MDITIHASFRPHDDPEAALAFYRDALGFEVRMEIPGQAAFLRAQGSANDHDLGLFEVGEADRPHGRYIGLYHLAWEVGTLAELAGLLVVRRPAVHGDHLQADRLRERLDGAGDLVGELAGRHDHDRARPWSDRLFDLVGIDVEGRGVDVDDYWHQTALNHRPYRRRPGERRNDHLVARLEPVLRRGVG